MAKSKGNIRSALGKSLEAEEKNIQQRFEQAEKIMDNQDDNLNPTKTVSEEKKEKTQRVIRDSFTLPVEDHRLINTLKQRCLQNAVQVNKSELIRAGLHALQQSSDSELLKILAHLTKVKTGRPQK